MTLSLPFYVGIRTPILQYLPRVARVSQGLLHERSEEFSWFPLILALLLPALLLLPYTEAMNDFPTSSPLQVGPLLGIWCPFHPTQIAKQCIFNRPPS